MIDPQIIFILQLMVLIASIVTLTRLYRMYIAPFDSLTTSLNFWRLRRALKQCYKHDNPDSISMDYRRKFKINNIELTYGEIILASFYAIMKIAKVKPHERFYDLGCGTGKLVCSAAILFDLKAAHGIEIQPVLLDFANRITNTLKAGRQANDAWISRLSRAHFHEADFTQFDFSDADIIFINATCYQLENWRKIEDKFKLLKPGSRILLTTKYLKEPHFELLYTAMYEMSWGYARVTLYRRTEYHESESEGEAHEVVDVSARSQPSSF